MERFYKNFLLRNNGATIIVSDYKRGKLAQVWSIYGERVWPPVDEAQKDSDVDSAVLFVFPNAYQKLTVND